MPDARVGPYVARTTHLVIEELTANGVVEPARFYENPYAPIAPEDLFDEATLNEFFAALDDLTKAAG